MVKRIRTILTLFLLVMGTAMSWAEASSTGFKPFKIDFRTNPYTFEGSAPENVNVESGEWLDEGIDNGWNTLGYYQASVTVNVDRPVKFTIGTNNFTNYATVSVNGGTSTVIKTNFMAEGGVNDGGPNTYNHNVKYVYKGTGPVTLVFNLGDYCPYFYAEEWVEPDYDEATKTFNVPAGDAEMLKNSIIQANAIGGNVTIYLPNGTYDLGGDANTEVIGDNIAIIGESRDGVIIKNAPAVEGLLASATLKNSSTGLYLQDLTLQCNAPYNSAATVRAERGVALWDRGTKTICKNVYLKSKQSTYYSNGAEDMKAYFEGGIIEGAVDLVCGTGNVLFNSVTLNLVNGTNPGNVIAAPSTDASELGYVFANCLVTGYIDNGEYYLARGWNEKDEGNSYSAATFFGCNFQKTPASGYWGATNGKNVTRRFAAFTIDRHVLSMDAGYDVDLSKVNLISFAGDWDPAQIISLHKPIKTNGAGWASYTAFTDVFVNGTDVKAYTAIKINPNTVTLRSVEGNKIPAGTPVFIKGANNGKYYVNSALTSATFPVNFLRPVLFDTTLEDGSNAFVLGVRDGVCGLYYVNSTVLVPAGKCYLDATGHPLVLAKDEVEMVIDDSETTGVGNVGVDSDSDAIRYNLAGQKVDKGYKGIVVRKDGKKYLAK